MSNPNKQSILTGVEIPIVIKLPPVPKSFALDTGGPESRISIDALSDAILRKVAAQWREELLKEARRLRGGRKPIIG